MMQPSDPHNKNSGIGIFPGMGRSVPIATYIYINI